MKPHAEVEEVWPRDGRIRLVGRIHGRAAGGAEDWRLLLALRGTNRQLRYAVCVKGDRFESELPVADLAGRDAEAGAGIEEWDLHLTDGEAVLRVGRQLDDIRGKKKIMVFPELRVNGWNVRPYYTVKDNLSLECRLEDPSGEVI